MRYGHSQVAAKELLILILAGWQCSVGVLSESGKKRRILQVPETEINQYYNNKTLTLNSSA